jgi:glucose/arabinose dehydrogenase
MIRLPALALVAIACVTTISSAPAQNVGAVLTGAAAFGDWRADAPGVRRLIKPSDLPRPFQTPSSRNGVSLTSKPAGAALKAPPGFEVHQFASGLDGPRIIRTAPNGDIFVAETHVNRVRVLRPTPDGSAVAINEIFASGLSRPFGVAFYPSGADPQWVYIANTNSVVRFPYRNGDLTARGKPEVIVPSLPVGGHSTRDVAFSNDGATMFVSVGSASNVAEGIGTLDRDELQKWTADKPLGAAWGSETERADVLAFDPQGAKRRIFATGIRNCVGLAVNPANGDLWCSVNERDALGDDLVPDYITRVREGAFYGWPWYYIGDHEDPRLKGERPDLKGKITVPDVLVQSHSASLGMMFYTGNQFPAEYKGAAFAAEHGSWNRAKRTGYKIIRVIMKDGMPTGEYEDFVTGFVVNDSSTWGRPVGVTQMKDGSLAFSEDGNGTIWRVTYSERRSSAQ